MTCHAQHLQVLEERDAATGNTTMQYSWSPVYVDAMIERDRDTDGNGSLDERLWVQQDANWNVTSVANGNGTVVERFVYEAYGTRTVLDAAWGVKAGSDVEWVYGWQSLRQDLATELYSTWTRWYSPALGRWSGQDWIGFKGGDPDLYRMENNSPVNYLDPLGMGIKFIPIYGPGGMGPPRPISPDSGAERAIPFRTASRAELENLLASLYGLAFEFYGLRSGSHRTGSDDIIMDNRVPWDIWLIGAGSEIPWTKFRQGFSGAESGLSKGRSAASWVFRGVLPCKVNYPMWAPTFQKPWATTKVAGAYVSRWIPWIGWGLLADDLIEGTPTGHLGQLGSGSGERGLFRIPPPEQRGNVWGLGLFVTEKGDYMDQLLDWLYTEFKWHPR
jgi:RHS repeat-associated protein